MLDEAELRRMTPHQRAELARALAEMDSPEVPAHPMLARRTRLLIVASVACAVALAAWIGFLVDTLPPHYRAGGWRIAWVGFDVALLLVFVATAWAAWQKRQILILCLVVLGTLLLCDAWFDVTLDLRTHSFSLSLLTALVIELPIAALALTAAYRLLRLTLGWVRALAGDTGPGVAFWRVPLYGVAPLGYRQLLPKARVTAEPGADACVRQQ
jgi:hypothetical protein